MLLLGVIPGAGPGAETPSSHIRRRVAFDTADGGRVVGNLYGRGNRGVVLAHGAVFDKESWEPLALDLADRGLVVLAIDFRGYGESIPGSRPRALKEDVLAAVGYMHREGAEFVSVIGGSMGATAAARASMETEHGDIDRLILLAPGPLEDADRLRAKKTFFVVSRGDRTLSEVKASFERAPEPKRITILDGSAHAQHIFRSEQAGELRGLLIDFLTSRTNP